MVSGLVLPATALVEGESLAIPDAAHLATLLVHGLVVQGVAWLMVSTALPHVKASLAGIALTLGAIYAGSVSGTRAKPAA